MHSKEYANSRFELYNNERDGVYLKEFNPEYVSVIALHDNKLVVVKQYREAVNQDTYELPGGRTEGDETLEEGARREILEETGFICGDMKYVGYLHNYSCMMNRRSHLFFTNHLMTQQHQELDDDENINVMLVDLETVFSNIKNGEWTDSELSVALLLARLKNYV